MATDHEQIWLDRNSYREDVTDISLFREYTIGKTKHVLTDKQKKILEGIVNLPTRHFCDNICHEIISFSNDRLDFNDWTCPVEDVQVFIHDLYVKGKLSHKQGSIHYNTLRDGNSCVSLSWNTGKGSVQIHEEKWWDGVSGVFVKYFDNGESDEVEYVVKEWPLTSGGYRRVIYRKGIIERYITDEPNSTKETTWQKFSLPGETHPVSVTKKGGEPLGIPFIHFSNSASQNGRYGMSELDRGVLGFQDQLDDLQYAMSAAGRLTAFQMYSITGYSPPKGTLEGEFPFTAGAGEIWYTSDSSAKIGVLPAGDLSQLISIYTTKLKAVARISKTPLFLITGAEWPSGDAIIRAEQPSIGKAIRQIHGLEDSWKMVGHRATEMFNAFSEGTSPLDENLDTAPINVKFSDPARRDSVSRAVVVGQLGEHISSREALRIMGYKEADIDRVMAERAEEVLENSVPFDRGEEVDDISSGKLKSTKSLFEE